MKNKGQISEYLLTYGWAILIVIIVGVVFWQLGAFDGKESTSRSCEHSGGTVTTTPCCQETEDFPDMCLIGACGCSPENSHNVTTCECPDGRCFDGTECVEV